MNNLRTIWLHTRVVLRLGFCFSFIAFSNVYARAQSQQNAPARGYSPSSEPVFSPHKSLVKTREFLDYISLRVFTDLNYREVNEEDGTWKTEGVQGILESRYFLRDIGNGVIRSIEILIVAHPVDGYEFYFFGNEIHGETNYINPELAVVKRNIRTIAQTVQSQLQERGVRDLGYEFYTLSYIQSDRVLALLKSIGYTITEFTQRNAESVYERIFDPQRSGEWILPVIVKVIDAPKTSLMESSPIVTRQEGYTVVPDIGGTFLHHTTSGEPLQRLLIVYDVDNPEPMEDLLNLLREKIDRPARQLVIEARIIVINTDRLKDLGVSFRYIDGDYDVSLIDNESGDNLPFTTVLNQDLYSEGFDFFEAKLKALVNTGSAEILSSPSVLALDGRQARIQIGQQVPVVKSTATASGIISSVEYFPVGIVLNIRPRISADGTEITMQVETIVSAVSQTVGNQQGQSSEVLFAPTIDNRQVQTFVRIADNTPFIIGGLISNDVRKRKVGIPFLSDIPVLGALFSRTTEDVFRNEVIIVITAHVVPPDAKSFSYVIPKDSEMFDSFDKRLFRNAYRIRDDDIFDLKFIYASEVYKNLIVEVRESGEEITSPELSLEAESIINGEVPGEAIIVRRMLWEVAMKTGFYKYIAPDHILAFEDKPNAADSSGYQFVILNQLLENRDLEQENSLFLTIDKSFRGTPDHPLALPKAKVTYETIGSSNYLERLIQGNKNFSDDADSGTWSTIISTINPPGVRGRTALEVLQGVMVLKRILTLNSTLPMTVNEFRVGRQIILPTETDLRQRFHIIDRDIARYFYQVIQYYPEFEKEFRQRTQVLLDAMR